MLIVAGCDDRYAMPLAVTLHSALRRLPSNASAHVLVVDAGIEMASKTRVERVVNQANPKADVEWASPDLAGLTGLRTTSWGSPASYLPLLIPTIARDAPMALYLDSDLLVKADLAALWESGRNGSDLVHAVADYGFRNLGEALKGDSCARLGLDGEAPYFNSGVMLMNLERWRSERIPERAFEFARDHPEAMRYTDQDALNAVIQGGWSHLDPRWNVLIGSVDRLLELSDADPAEKDDLRRRLLEHPNVVHFSGPQKPWKPGYRRLFRSDYLSELTSCGWFDTDSEKRSFIRSRAVRSPWARLKRTATKAAWPAVVAMRRLTTGRHAADLSDDD
jgi:lipopolysaccharide biosynthesis glycosyltransferase